MPYLATKGAARRDRRLSLRVTEQERRLIEQAALLCAGGDVTRFVMQASVEAARATVEQYEATRVTSEFREHLYDLLLNPPPPSAALRKLAAKPVPAGDQLIEK
jgi:uncharacterized protein (DUF1778 family)